MARPNISESLTEIMLSVFRLNAMLLQQGDRLVAPLGLTSARWQILGAIAIAGEPQTAPQIAAAMGVTRQGAQKQLDLAVAEGLVEPMANPRHERSLRYSLTAAGARAYDAAMGLQRCWVQALAKGLGGSEVRTAREALAALEDRLASTPLPSG